MYALLVCRPDAFAGDAILAWDPNTEPDLAGYKVHYGTAPGTYSVVSDVGDVTTLTVTGLGPGTYYLAVTAYDTSGNESAASNEVSKSFADTTPPVISAVASGTITNVGAKITWVTDEASSSQVEYGTTTAYGTSSALAATLVTSHTINLTGLAPSTTYHFRVTSADAAGNAAVSADNTFTTASAPDTTAPVISAVASGALTNTGATVTWATDEASSSQVEYGTTTAYGTSSALAATLVTSHTMTLTGLAPSTTYHFRVTSADAAGNAAASTDKTFTTSSTPDTTAPVISNVVASSITSSGATVTWTTDEGSTSLVEYGKTTTYGSTLAETTSFVTAHSRALTGLSAATTYHYRVRNRDAAGNLGTSGDFTFATNSAPDTTAPVLSGITASAITASSAVITWSTNEPATSVVDYGPSTAYGSSSVLNTTPVTSHSRALTGITPSTTYHYRVKSVDGSGNVATSSDRTFTTSSAADTTAPTISAVTAGAITFDSAEITWTTNEAATSLVQYSTDLSFNLSSSLATTPVTSHSVPLTGLTAATIYNYRVVSTDPAGNTAQSEPHTFTTTAEPDTIPPQAVQDFSATGDTGQATLTWVNPPDADFTGVRIRYRTDRFPTDPDDGSLLGDFTGQPDQPMSTTHQDLTDGVTYFYAATTYDASGNRQNTVYASATPSSPASAGPQSPVGGCGMIAPRNGGPPGPWKAADLFILVAVALFLIRRKWAPVRWCLQWG
ncbi:MAG: fibronectin type III domain-containing protein [Nitrospirae bacterium]|nr:fibronectin type III domain-containing protein [Nitrospirota bacterium]